jgi:SWIM zinc finger
MPKPLQFFLDKSGVSTVSLGEDEKTLTCDCPTFKKKQKCKHATWVTERVDKSTGVYPVQVSKRATEDEMKAAFIGGSLEVYKDFMLKYGRVEVLKDSAG